MKFKIDQPVRFKQEPFKTGTVVGVWSGSFIIVLLDVIDKNGNRAVVVDEDVVE